VNEIGNNTKCDGGSGYWSDTVIIITWDDWGGWYDHEPPTILPGNQGDYQYGFRVPMIVVSAYTPPHYISNLRHDFGSILRGIEALFELPGGEGALGFADARATSDLQNFFDLSQPPRKFQTIDAPLNADFFLHDERPPEPPDTD
jgi:phospholipase C